MTAAPAPPPLPLARQRCLHHAEREAAARCRECSGFFCRECVVEHDDRFICAVCLRKIAVVKQSRRSRFHGLLRMAQVAAGIFTAWIFFYLVGRVLLTIPSSFHEGTVVQELQQERTF